MPILQRQCEAGSLADEGGGIVKNKTDLNGWVIFSHEEEMQLAACIEPVLRRAAIETVNLYIKETDVSWPQVWGTERDGHGGPGVSDPLTVYLYNPEESVLIKKLSLTDDLLGTISDCEKDGSFSEGLSLISAHLKTLAAQIDAAILSGKKGNQSLQHYGASLADEGE